jgi:hypothetical protein
MNAIDEGGRFWVYDPKTTSWTRTPEPKGDIPEPRSYHAMTAIEVRLIANGLTAGYDLSPCRLSCCGAPFNIAFILSP